MNKYLEKVAVSVNYMHTMGAGAAVGAGLGAWAGYSEKKKRVPTGWFSSKQVDKTKHERVLSGISGAITGGYAGAALGFYAHPDVRRSYRGYKYGGGGAAGNTTTSRTIHDIHADLGMPKGGFKTKAEATAHFRKARSKHHPDRYQGAERERANERMSKLNRAWDEFQAHPEGFTKLANAYLEKIAKINWAKVQKHVKDNPGAVIGGVLGGIEGGSSTLKLKREGEAKYRLRQVKNAVVGAGFGAATGKLVQTGLQAVSD